MLCNTSEKNNQSSAIEVILYRLYMYVKLSQIAQYRYTLLNEVQMYLV